MKKLILFFLLAICSALVFAQPKLSPDNIDQVLQAMTLEEKASLLVGVSPGNLVPGTAGGTRAIPAGPGLVYSYCEGSPMSVAQVAASPVKSSGIAPVFSTSYKERDDHFGLIFKGLLKIENGGIYRLSLTSDDGSALWLDGQPLLDLDHDGGGTADAWVKLEAGYHRLEVRFFENFAEEALRVGLEGPGLVVENITANMLYHE